MMYGEKDAELKKNLILVTYPAIPYLDLEGISMDNLFLKGHVLERSQLLVAELMCARGLP